MLISRAKRLRQCKRSNRRRVLNKDSIPNNIKNAQYAVRGEMVIRANKYLDQLKSNPSSLPFKKIVFCNIGNPQELGQPPITFIRQVVSLIENPQALNSSYVTKLYPDDVIKRVKAMIKEFGFSTGAYTHSQGFEFVRRNVAEYIRKRDEKNDDNYSHYSNIFLSDGASPAVQTVLKLLIRNEHDGIMIPIPQYPLYSASIPLFHGTQVPYYLDEDKDWGLEVKELRKSIDHGRKKGLDVRALVVINPGNPTGQCLSKQNMADIVKFCVDEGIVLIADEVYQENVYVKEFKPFYSFKNILSGMPSNYRDMELFSFNSISKGFIGECGKRGGYVEATNIDADALNELYKISSINLCPNSIGQIMMDCMVNPPQPGDISYPLYIKEKEGVYNSLKRRAIKAVKVLNSLPGISCNPAEGAMYCFPRIHLPEDAIEEAQKQKKSPDLFYCIRLLDETGICVVPGSGFGQKKGEYHFRTTFLPREEEFDQVLNDFANFHKRFMKEYKD